MGKYTDSLEQRLRARQVAQGVHHPRGAGVAMWCPACGKQMLVTPCGVAPSLKQQQEAVEMHRRECELLRMWPLIQREKAGIIQRRAGSLRRWAWWRRNRWKLLALAGAILMAVVWLVGSRM